MSNALYFAGLLDGSNVCGVIFIDADQVGDHAVELAAIYAARLPERVNHAMDFLPLGLKLLRRDYAKRPCPVLGLVVATDEVSAGIAFPEGQGMQVSAMWICFLAACQARRYVALAPATKNALAIVHDILPLHCAGDRVKDGLGLGGRRCEHAEVYFGSVCAGERGSSRSLGCCYHRVGGSSWDNLPSGNLPDFVILKPKS